MDGWIDLQLAANLLIVAVLIPSHAVSRAISFS